MNNFIDTYLMITLNQDQINHLNITISGEEIEAVVHSLPSRKAQDQMGLVEISIRSSKKS